MEASGYGVVHFFPGGTKDQYEASTAAVHPGEGLLPEGQIFHAAGASGGGWTVMAVHDSKESWEKFRDGILLPRIAGYRGRIRIPTRADRHRSVQDHALAMGSAVGILIVGF
ncbi:hypothetical protein QFZ40_001072 [Arthrobacter pascens]|nr:hypothetical protein [Arthrobacter pascens]